MPSRYICKKAFSNMKKLLFIVLSLVTIFSGCKPEDETSISGPKPYEINYPILYGKPNFIASDNPLTEEGVDLGRHLFYDRMLSLDYSKSCSSCHQQAFGFSDPLKLSGGINAQLTERHSMAIANVSWQNAFFWDGRVQTLEEQALLPIQNPVEMGMNLDSLIARLKASQLYRNKFANAFPNEEISKSTLAKAIAQFEHSLISANSRYDQYKLGMIDATDQEKRGERLFFTHPEPGASLRGGNCGDCHAGTLTFANNFSNNGLDAVFSDSGRADFTKMNQDVGKFKIPSLRNVALTAPYMHDGRFSSLEEVLDHYNEHVEQSSTLDPLMEASNNNPPLHTSLGLTDQEKADIIEFLKMLTDQSFVTDPKHSNPFPQE